MTNKQTWLGLCIACIILLPSLSMAQNNLRLSDDFDKVQQAVQQNESWMYLFPDDDLPSFGFNNSNELKMSHAGDPIEVFYMYRDYDGNPGITNPDEFLVPVIYNNEVRAFVTVALFEGKFQVVSAGEMTLAKDASSIIMQQRASRTKLVWLKQLNYQADFIATASGSNNLFYPLFTAKRTFVNEPATYNSLENYFQTLPLSFN